MTPPVKKNQVTLKLTLEEFRALTYVARERKLQLPRSKNGAPLVLRQMGVDEAVQLYRNRVRPNDIDSPSGGPGGPA